MSGGRLCKVGGLSAKDLVKKKLAIIVDEKKRKNVEEKRKKAIEESINDGFCSTCFKFLFAHERCNCDANPKGEMHRQLPINLSIT